MYLLPGPVLSTDLECCYSIARSSHLVYWMSTVYWDELMFLFLPNVFGHISQCEVSQFSPRDLTLFCCFLCCMKHDKILIERFFFFSPPTFWAYICSVVFSKTVLLKTYYWDASLFIFSRVVLFCGCNHCYVFLFVIVCVCVCLSIWNSFQNQILQWFSWVEVASCQFGIIDMIQLQEVTATLCIFKGPQWLYLSCWLLAFEPFYLVVRHVVI